MPPQMAPGDDGESRRRPEIFFARADTVAQTGNYDYSIELYIQGLRLDPDNVDAHQRLRRIALERKARGGRDMGVLEKSNLLAATRGISPMLAAEKLLAYSPGDRDRMVEFFTAAQAGGFAATSAWFGAILRAGEQ